MSDAAIERVREILAAVKPLAAEYYRLTGKPLGVTGEVAEYVAAETLDLVLADARTPGYDATRQTRTARSAFRSRAAPTATMPSRGSGFPASRPTRHVMRCFWCCWTTRRLMPAKCGKPRSRRLLPASPSPARSPVTGARWASRSSSAWPAGCGRSDLQITR